MLKKILSVFFAVMVLMLSSAQAGQKEQIIKTYITGDQSTKANFDEMMGTDVQLVNHYLFWKNGQQSQSINIEHLQQYFLFYSSKAEVALCKNPSRISRHNDNINSTVPQDFVDSFKGLMNTSMSMYPEFKQLSPFIKEEMAIYEFCQFAYLSYLSLPFDPAGIGGLKRNFEFPEAFDRTRDICIPITHQILKDEFNRGFVLLTLPTNMETNRLCKQPK